MKEQKADDKIVVFKANLKHRPTGKEAIEHDLPDELFVNTNGTRYVFNEKNVTVITRVSKEDETDFKNKLKVLKLDIKDDKDKTIEEKEIEIEVKNFKKHSFEGVS